MKLHVGMIPSSLCPICSLEVDGYLQDFRHGHFFIDRVHRYIYVSIRSRPMTNSGTHSMIEPVPIMA